ncbi:MAG TPA: hypothetical protein VFX02_03135, partial [Gammaproteobacteria bacterium]|nr:hypothetical protein [Gammaproteobacteria bacterium]
VCIALQWSGISDVALYDLIEQRLNEILVRKIRGGDDLEIASWYAKGLAASGMDKYLTVMRRMASTRQPKLAHYAEESMSRIESYKKWNPIISDEKNFHPDQPLQVNRFANMLKSGDSELKLMALKRMRYEHIYSEYLLDIVRDDLMAGYKSADATSAGIEVFESETGVLGDSRNMKYHDSLEQVYSETKDRPKLRYSISQAMYELKR